MPEKTFKEQILEEFDKFSEDIADFTWDGYYNFQTELRDFISQALDKQRDEFVKCLPKGETFDSGEAGDAWDYYEESLLNNLKKAKLI
jgi:hypothetical protein